MGRYYILRDSEVVEEHDHARWEQWYNSSTDLRNVASTELAHGTVSTVFLALNMTLSKTDPPMLFETRVHGGWLANEGQRYATLEEAKAGHEAWVARVREAESENAYPPPGHPVW
jgi:hypothetical protein